MKAKNAESAFDMFVCDIKSRSGYGTCLTCQPKQCKSVLEQNILHDGLGLGWVGVGVGQKYGIVQQKQQILFS